MAEYIERLGWNASDIGSKKIIKMVDYEAMKVAFDEKFKETMKLIQSGETHLDNLAEGFHEADGVIFRMPAADVAPVVHSEWLVEREGNGWDDWFNLTCKNCGKKYRKMDAPKVYRYCYTCGAKMDGERE